MIDTKAFFTQYKDTKILELVQEIGEELFHQSEDTVIYAIGNAAFRRIADSVKEEFLIDYTAELKRLFHADDLKTLGSEATSLLDQIAFAKQLDELDQMGKISQTYHWNAAADSKPCGLIDDKFNRYLVTVSDFSPDSKTFGKSGTLAEIVSYKGDHFYDESNRLVETDGLIVSAWMQLPEVQPKKHDLTIGEAQARMAVLDAIFKAFSAAFNHMVNPQYPTFSNIAQDVIRSFRKEMIDIYEKYFGIDQYCYDEIVIKSKDQSPNGLRSFHWTSLADQAPDNQDIDTIGNIDLDQLYIVRCQDDNHLYTYDTLVYYSDNQFLSKDDSLSVVSNVIDWMPLPVPYQVSHLADLFNSLEEDF